MRPGKPRSWCPGPGPDRALARTASAPRTVPIVPLLGCTAGTRTNGFRAALNSNVRPRWMIPSEIRDRIREGIAPALLEAGFRGRSSTFSREVGDVFHLIQLQASTSNSIEGARFTVNVAVWAPVLAREPKPSVIVAHWSR